MTDDNTPAKPNSYNIGIAGAGLMGRLLALELHLRGHTVTIFDKDHKHGEGSCSMTAAGLLTPFGEVDSAEPLIINMGRYSLSRWPNILSQLKQPVFFQQKGSLMIAHHQDQAEFNRYHHYLTTKLNDSTAYQLIDGAELANLEPQLEHRFNQAYYFPIEGQLSTSELFAALTTTLNQLKIEWHPLTVVTKLTSGLIECGSQSHEFDWVLDCRGLGAKDDWRELRGVRGEIIWLHAPNIHLQRPIRLMHPRYPIYITPRPGNTYLVGASRIESDDMSQISLQTSLELLSAAYSLDPGFAEARVIKTAVNCRPALPNNLPCIYHSEGLVRINGLYRHGYLLAPAIADDVCELIDNGASKCQFSEIIRGVHDHCNFA